MKPTILPMNEGRRLNVMSSNVVVKVSGAETEGRYALADMNDGAGVEVPLHVHENEDGTFHVLEGQYEFNPGNRKVTAGAGTTVHLPRGAPHGFRTVGPGRNRALVMAAPSGLEEMFAELDALPPGPPDLAKVTAVCHRYRVRFL